MGELVKGIPETETVNGLGPHVYSETDTLRKLIMWGLPGPETALAQFLPLEESLFYDRFDVQESREEYARLLAVLKEKGVQVVLVQDVLARGLNEEDLQNNHMIPGSIDELVSALKHRGHVLHEKYKGLGELDLLDLIPELVREDVERLGERQAIVLNWLLSLRNYPPLGNIFYGRDQSNVLGDTLFISS